MRLVDVVVEAETVGNLCVRRIPQHGIAAADHDGNIADPDLETIEQFLRVAVAVEIDIVKRVAVPGQELVVPKRSRAVHRADHDDVAQVPGDQFEAAQDERPHQDLAQLRVGLDDGEQLLAIELDHVAGLADAQA